MRKKVILTVIFISLLFPLSAQKTPKQILDEFGKTLSIPCIQGAFKVKLISKNGDVREIEARAFQKYMGETQINRLFVFDFPPRVRGTGLLLHSFYDGRDNNMWIYLPTVKRVKRIALESSGGGYFMGSDFTYRDLINNDVNDMEFDLLEDKTVNGVECHTVKSWGKSAEVRQELGYSYIVTYYSKDKSILQRREYFDFNDKLLKVYEVGDYFISGPYHYPRKVSMTNVQTQHKSVIEVTEIITDDIPDSFFTTRYLQGN